MATLGVEEKALLLKVGAVRRVIKAVVAINASVAQVKSVRVAFLYKVIRFALSRVSVHAI